MISVSTTVVSQLTSSSRYMLGLLTRLVGVQSYSDNPKKSSSLDVIEVFTHVRARRRAEANAAEAFTRMVPPRCEDLGK